MLRQGRHRWLLRHREERRGRPVRALHAHAKEASVDRSRCTIARPSSLDAGGIRPPEFEGRSTQDIVGRPRRSGHAEAPRADLLCCRPDAFAVRTMNRALSVLLLTSVISSSALTGLVAGGVELEGRPQEGTGQRFIDELKRGRGLLRLLEVGSSIILSWPDVPGTSSYLVLHNGEQAQRLPANETSATISSISLESLFIPKKARIRPEKFVVLALDGSNGILRMFSAEAPCADHGVIAAMGSGESFVPPYGLGSRGTRFLRALREELGATHRSLPAIAVDFPAVAIFNGTTLGPGASPSVYRASVEEGVRAAISAIEQIIADCPGTGLILFGYSQGGHVMGDVFTRLSDGQRDHITRVVLFAEARYRPGDRTVTYLPGPLPGSGINGARLAFPARSRAVIESWCASDDAICQGLRYGRAAHGPEYDAYERDAARRAATALRRRTKGPS